MAQALLIKTANTDLKTVGDIVGIFEDTHKFSEHELLAFNVAKIEGTREEVATKLNAIRIEIETAYRATSTEWSRTQPEEKQVWKDTDDKWYFLEVELKYQYSMALLTESEKTTLETQASGLARDVAFKNMIVNPGTWDSKNQVEATDLNAAILVEK